MVGEIAPNFSLPDQEGNIFELYANLDSKVLLVFYPKDESTVCTKQLTNYNLNLEEMSKKNIRIVAINTASEKSHLSFCNNHSFKFPLLSDKKKEISKKYKALNLFGINKRKLVLVNTNRKIVYENVVKVINYVNAEYILSELVK